MVDTNIVVNDFPSTLPTYSVIPNTTFSSRKILIKSNFLKGFKVSSNLSGSRVKCGSSLKIQPSQSFKYLAILIMTFSNYESDCKLKIKDNDKKKRLTN